MDQQFLRIHLDESGKNTYVETEDGTRLAATCVSIDYCAGDCLKATVTVMVKSIDFEGTSILVPMELEECQYIARGSK